MDVEKGMQGKKRSDEILERLYGIKSRTIETREVLNQKINGLHNSIKEVACDYAPTTIKEVPGDEKLSKEATGTFEEKLNQFISQQNLELNRFDEVFASIQSEIDNIQLFI